MAFVSLSDLPLGRAHRAVCVRVVRLWDYCGNKEDQPPLHVDMVLVDEKENRMYAEIPGTEAEKFKHLIKEGEVYVFRKFIVSNSKPAYKPFQSTQMIRFSPWTSVDHKKEGIDKIPKFVFDLVEFEEFPSRVGQMEYFLDTIGIIVGVSEIAYVRLPSNQTNTAKRVISLKDLRNNQISLVLWGNRAVDFDAETVHSIGQESPVVAIFVGMLLKSYKSENMLSGGSACKWYINEEIPEIEAFFERMYSNHTKIEWISAGEQQFRSLEQQKNLEDKSIAELRDIDPWEFEPWWFSSCTKCHRASVPHGSGYKCSGGCPSTTAEPKYRLCLIGTDGTASAEFVLFGRVARQIVGKPVISLIRSANKNHIDPTATDPQHILPELAALVSQKFTFSVSFTQKSLTQRNISFQVNSIVTFFGKQSYIPKPTNPPSSSNDAAVSRSQISPTVSDNNTALQKKQCLDRRPIPPKKALELVPDSEPKDIDEEHPKSSTNIPETTKELQANEIVVLDKSLEEKEDSQNQWIVEDDSTVTMDGDASKSHSLEKAPVALQALGKRSSSGRKKTVQ